MKLPDLFKENFQEERVLNFTKEHQYSDVRKIIHNSLTEDLSGFYYPGMGHQIFIANVAELVRNAYDHGDASENGLEFGYFYSPENIIIGCRDGGEYFKKDSVKKQWENKERIKSSGKRFDDNGEQTGGWNIGIGFIQKYYKNIFIDTLQGAFFGRVNFEREDGRSLLD